MTGWFVGLTLFFPRLALAGYWLMGNMPANETTFWLDVAMFWFAPRLLVGWWLWQDAAWHPLWSVLFVVFYLSSAFGGANASRGDD